MIPVPMISPATAVQMRPRDACAGERRAENGSRKRQRRDAHQRHADDADERGAEESLPRPQKDGAHDIDEMRHGAHALDAKDRRYDDAQSHHHGQKDEPPDLLFFFQIFHSFRKTPSGRSPESV